MILTDISHARFEGADCVVGIVAGVDICDLSVIIIQSLSKIMLMTENHDKTPQILCAFRICHDCQSGAP